MKQYILNGEAMTTREDAHREIAAKLGFPSWYGANLDALWDLLQDMQGEIIILHHEKLLGSLGTYGVKLIQTFREAEDLATVLQ